MKKLVATTMAALFITVAGASAASAAPPDIQDKPGIHKDYKHGDKDHKSKDFKGKKDHPKKDRHDHKDFKSKKDASHKGQPAKDKSKKPNDKPQRSFK